MPQSHNSHNHARSTRPRAQKTHIQRISIHPTHPPKRQCDGTMKSTTQRTSLWRIQEINCWKQLVKYVPWNRCSQANINLYVNNLYDFTLHSCLWICTGNDGCIFGTTAAVYTAQKMKFSIKDFFSKCDQIRRKLKKSLMENFIFVKC